QCERQCLHVDRCRDVISESTQIVFDDGQKAKGFEGHRDCSWFGPGAFPANRATGTIEMLSVSRVWVMETERWISGRSEMQHSNMKSKGDKEASDERERVDRGCERRDEDRKRGRG